MASKQITRPKIAHRDISNGYLHTYDANGRLCLDIESRERIVIVNDLRAYDAELGIGALGWTIPETTDGYTYADIAFDNGQTLRLKRYAFERVTVDFAKVVADELIARNRNTRFDADPIVAASFRDKWIAENYGEFLTFTEMVSGGTGDQELYAFTFPSLIELTRLNTTTLTIHHPIGIWAGFGG